MLLAQQLATLPELDTTCWVSSLLGLNNWVRGAISGAISDAPVAGVHRVCLLVAPLAPCLDIAATGTAAAQPHLHQPRKDGHRTRNPHECKHCDSNLGADVQFRHATNSVAEDDEHDGCEDGCDGNEERVEEGEDGDGEGEPAREDRQRHDEDEDEGEDGAGEEKTEHPVRHEPNQVEDVINVGGEVDYGMLDVRP